MKALKKIKVTEESILSSRQMGNVRGGSGSGSGGWDGDGYYQCSCQDWSESWYEIYSTAYRMWEDIYSRCGGPWGGCSRES